MPAAKAAAEQQELNHGRQDRREDRPGFAEVSIGAVGGRRGGIDVAELRAQDRQVREGQF